MPLILTAPAAPPGQSGATLTGRARTTASRGAVLAGRAASRVQVVGATLTGRAVSRPESRGATLTGVLSGGLPVQVMPGAPPLRTVQNVTGLPGTVMSWSYGHTLGGETFDVTVDGQFGAALPTVNLTARARHGERVVDELPTRAFRQFGQEPQVDVGGNRTTFRFALDFTQKLRGARLPELIPWVLNPSPPACPPRRQRVQIGPLVQQVMRQYVDPQFALGVPDPLGGAEWVEGLVEYSTDGITAQQLWDDTYGLLGLTLTPRRFGAGQRLVGLYPEPTTPATGPDRIERRWVTLWQDGQERLQTPTRLTLLGAGRVTDLDATGLLAWIGEDPARAELERELLPNGEWIDPEVREGTATTSRGWRRVNGQVTQELSVTTDDLTVQETVDGAARERTFRRVATGYSLTSTTFDPACPTRPLSQRTESRSWAYDVDTITGSFQTLGPGLYYFLTTGNLTGSEVTRVTFEYSPQGHLARELRVTDELGTTEQEGAFDEPGARGAVRARAWTRRTQDTRYSFDGAGRTRRVTTTTRQTLVPLFDVETGDAVRLVSVARTLPQPPEVSDQAPPTFDCDPCGGVFARTVVDPSGVVLRSGDAGFAEERTVTAPFLKPADLTAAARTLMTLAWHRRTVTVTVRYPTSLQPGDVTGLGLVREVKMTGDAWGVTSTVTFAALDDLFGGSGSAAVEDWRADPKAGRALVLAGRPGGVRARRVLGWSAGAGEPIVQDAFIRTRSGVARPGEEVDWRMVNGTLEVTGAR